MNEYIIDKKKRICLIGGNGYIGSRLMHFLLFRTDFNIVVVSEKYHDFNKISSEKLVIFTADQDKLPQNFFNTFDCIISLAPYSNKIPLQIHEDTMFIFTDPRYQQIIHTNQYFYYIDSAEVNGFSLSFDLSKNINSSVYEYKIGNSGEINPKNDIPFISIIDFCRYIESLIIYGKKEYSGRYYISSETSNEYPYEFMSYDTIQSITDDILLNWDDISYIKTTPHCIICDSESYKTKNNPDFLYCSNCFHIQRKDFNLTFDGYNPVYTHDTYFSLLNYPEYFIGAQNVLIVIPHEIKEDEKKYFEEILVKITKNDNLLIEFARDIHLNNVYSLFDIILIPYGIELLCNPYRFLEKISSKLFDQGKLIIQSSNTLSFIGRYNVDIPKQYNSFFNTSSMKILCNKVGLYLKNSYYLNSNSNLFVCYKAQNNNTSSILVEPFMHELEYDVYQGTSY